MREAKLLVRDRPTGIETARIAAARRTSAEGQEGLRAFLDSTAEQPVTRRGGGTSRPEPVHEGRVPMSV